MKILHIGITVNGRGEGLSEAFHDSNHDYKELPVNDELPARLNALNWNPDLVFVQIQSEFALKIINQINHLKKQGSFVINWTGDARNYVPLWMRKFPADVTTFSNMRDVRAFPNAQYLQIGFDPKTYKNWQEPNHHDVVFMGNESAQFPLTPERKSMIAAIKSMSVNKMRVNFGLYGSYQGSITALNPDPQNPFPIQSQESKIYAGSKIGINYSHYNIERYTSDRMFRMLGSGIMVLSHYYEGIEDEFIIGEELDVFRTTHELKSKIEYYLNNEEKRSEIAANGYQIAHRFFTYKSMVQSIIKIYEKAKM